MVNRTIPTPEQIEAMTTTEYKSLEARLRRAAERQGLLLEKSRARDARAVDFGTYRLVDERNGAVAMRDWEMPRGFGLTLDDVARYLFERQVREDDEARRQAMVYPYSRDVSSLKVTVNGILIVAISERLDEDLRARALGTNTLGGMLADIAQRATPTPGNRLVYQSTVAPRLGGAPRRVLIEQFGPNAARMDYAS